MPSVVFGWRSPVLVSATDGKKGQHTTKHLIRYVGLTEDEILKISFENEHVHRTVNTDKDGKADTLFFEYKK